MLFRIKWSGEIFDIKTGFSLVYHIVMSLKVINVKCMYFKWVYKNKFVTCVTKCVKKTASVISDFEISNF